MGRRTSDLQEYRGERRAARSVHFGARLPGCERLVERARDPKVPLVESNRIVKVAAHRPQIRGEPLGGKCGAHVGQIDVALGHCRTSCGIMVYEKSGRPLREHVSRVTVFSGYLPPPTKIVD